MSYQHPQHPQHTKLVMNKVLESDTTQKYNVPYLPFCKYVKSCDRTMHQNYNNAAAPKTCYEKNPYLLLRLVGLNCEIRSDVIRWLSMLYPGKHRLVIFPVIHKKEKAHLYIA